MRSNGSTCCGYFAVTISHLFFPGSDEMASPLLALGTFGAAYLVRPLGAIVPGAYAEPAGRNEALSPPPPVRTISPGWSISRND